MGKLMNASARARIGGAMALAAALIAAFVLACGLSSGTAWAGSGTALTTAASKSGPIVNGDYYIRSALSSNMVADVSGGSTADNANIQLYVLNKTTAQKWHFAYNATGGYYTITSKLTGKALTATSSKSGANVVVRASKNLSTQHWIVEARSGGYKLKCAANKNIVLDVAGGKTANGTNIRVYKDNGGKSQAFTITAVKKKVAVSTATIEKGAYTIVSVNSGKVLDITSASRATGANVQQYKSNGSYAQRFWIEPNGKGYYRIFNIGSGLALDVANGSTANGGNIQQYTWNGTNAQLWAIMKNSDGSYTFKNVASGKVLDVANGSTANGANIQQYVSNGSKAQHFKLKKAALLSTGTVTLAGAFSTGRVIDVPNASRAAGKQLQMYTSNDSLAQRFIVASAGGGAFTLRSCVSGYYVGVNSKGAIVQQKAKYLWKVTYGASGARRGIMFKAANGSKVSIAASGSGQSATLRSEAPANKRTHMFLPTKTNFLDNGYFTIRTALGSRVLDVANGSTQVGANIQLYAANKTAAQVFYIQNAGDGYYTITNASSKKAVAVENGSKKSGANVKQLAKGKDASKLWKITLLPGGAVTFQNKASGNYLTVAGNKNANGANVNSTAANGSKGQKWYLTATYEPGSTSWIAQRALSKISGKSSATTFFVAVDLSNHYVMIFRGSVGNWKLDRMFQCTNGAASTPTPTGDYTIGARGFQFNGDWLTYSCYYWTQFYGNYLFHSVIYNYNSNTVQDGRLGMYLSHGCVRLAIDNAKWIMYNVDSGSHVYVYN